jgi:hypothetical protein
MTLKGGKTLLSLLSVSSMMRPIVASQASLLISCHMRAICPLVVYGTTLEVPVLMLRFRLFDDTLFGFNGSAHDGLWYEIY